MNTTDGKPGITDCTKRETARPRCDGRLAPGRLVMTGDHSTKPDNKSNASVAALAMGEELCAATAGVRRVPTAIAVNITTAATGLLTNARTESMARGLVSLAARAAGSDASSIGAASRTRSSLWTTSAVRDQ